LLFAGLFLPLALALLLRLSPLALLLSFGLLGLALLVTELLLCR
jgi:hypothetical protein